jgi:hypothetical protein
MITKDQHREIHGQSWLGAKEEGGWGSGVEVEVILAQCTFPASDHYKRGD